MEGPCCTKGLHVLSIPQGCLLCIEAFKDPSKVWMSKDGMLKDLLVVVVLCRAGCSSSHRAGRSPRVVVSSEAQPSPWDAQVCSQPRCEELCRQSWHKSSSAHLGCFIPLKCCAQGADCAQVSGMCVSSDELSHEREEAGTGHHAGGEGQGTSCCSEHGDMAQGLPTCLVSLPSSSCAC